MRAIKFQGKVPFGMTLADQIPKWLFNRIGPAARSAALEMEEEFEPIASQLGQQFGDAYNALAKKDATERIAIEHALLNDTQPFADDPLPVVPRWQRPPVAQRDLPFDPVKPLFFNSASTSPRVEDEIWTDLRFAASRIPDGLDALNRVRAVFTEPGLGGHRNGPVENQALLIRTPPAVRAADVPAARKRREFTAYHELQHATDMVADPAVFKDYPQPGLGGRMPPEYWVHPAETRANATAQELSHLRSSHRQRQRSLPRAFMRDLAMLGAQDFGQQALYTAYPGRHPWVRPTMSLDLGGEPVWSRPEPEQLALLKALR